MSEKVPIMDEYTHSRILDALLDIKMERPEKARRTLHRALDRLDDEQTEWENHSGTDQRVAYGAPPNELDEAVQEEVFEAFASEITQPTEEDNEGA